MRPLNCFSLPKAMLLTHEMVLYKAVSPLQQCSSVQEMTDHLERPNVLQHQIRCQALVPWFLFSYIVVDTLGELARAGFRYDPAGTGMSESFMHKIYVRDAWPVTDIISMVGILMSYSIWCCFLAYPAVDQRVVMHVILNEHDRPVVYSNGKAFDLKESAELYKLVHSSPFGRILKYTVFVIAPLFVSFLLSQFIGFNFVSSPKDYIFAGILPPIIVYLFYSNFALIIHFILTVQCFGVRGRRQIAKLYSLVQNLPKSKKLRKHRRARRTFRIVNAALLRQQKELGIFNAFWSRLLTDYFIVYIIELCYLTYTILFYWTRLHPFLNFFNIAGLTFIFAIPCEIVNECRRLLHNNASAFRLMREFYIGSLRVDKTKRNRRHLLKFDAFEANHRRFISTGFSLLDGLLLSSKTFELMILYTSTFFMMICGHRLQHRYY